jgi:two-component system sensor histidine kinase BaeS
MSPRIVLQPDSEGKFLRSASQELRTPLTAIRGYAEGLAEGVFTAEEAVGTILIESIRLEHLIRDLLDVARIERGQFSPRSEPIELMSLAREVIARHESDARRHGITLIGEGVRTWVVGDPDRVGRVTSNLVECAVRRAYAPGATVVVRSGARGLTVSHSGIGSLPSGAWLGLMIARTLTIAMGGDVSVESGGPRGTTFTLRLPGPGEPAPSIS